MTATLTDSTRSAFMDWYEPVHDHFVRYCKSKSFGQISADDLVQDSILATLVSFEKINDKQKLLSYMIQTANNIIKNKLRRNKFKGAWDQAFMLTLEAKVRDPEIALDIKYLYRCIDQLTDTQKECILLYEISGFSIREVSVIQGVTEQAVKTRLHRGRKALKELMNKAERTSSLSSVLSVCASILF